MKALTDTFYNDQFLPIAAELFEEIRVEEWDDIINEIVEGIEE